MSLAPLWFFAVFGAISYIGVVAVLIAQGIALDTASLAGAWCFSGEPPSWLAAWYRTWFGLSPSLRWAARDATFFALIGLSLRAAGRAMPDMRAPARVGLAQAMTGMGAAWLLLGLLDQHVFGLFNLNTAGVAFDAHWLFHGVGAAMLIFGVALLATAPRALTHSHSRGLQWQPP